MGMILVTPTKAAKTKLARMAANLQIPLRTPNAVPLQQPKTEETRETVQISESHHSSLKAFALAPQWRTFWNDSGR